MAMHTWFECKIRYEKVMENGMQKKVTEPYLVDALSFTEAEARIIEEMTPFISGEFTVSDIKRANYSELFPSDEESADGKNVYIKYNIEIENMNCKSFSEAPQWKGMMQQILSKYTETQRPELIILLGQAHSHNSPLRQAMDRSWFPVSNHAS